MKNGLLFGLLVALQLTGAACLGYEWPPPPKIAAAPPLVIGPNQYVLTGTREERPFAARVEFADNQYILRTSESRCAGKVSELVKQAARPSNSEPDGTQIYCDGLRYVLAFNLDGRLIYARAERDVQGTSVRRRVCAVRGVMGCEEYVDELVAAPVEVQRIPLTVTAVPPDSTSSR